MRLESGFTMQFIRVGVSVRSLFCITLVLNDSDHIDDKKNFIVLSILQLNCC